MRKKGTPPREPLTKECPQCGEVFQEPRLPSGFLIGPTSFARRKYCSVECQWHSMHQPTKSSRASRRTAQRICKRMGMTSCQDCGRVEPPLHAHHLDEDYFNNDPSNLTLLCSPCHGRRHRQVLPKRPCRICKRLYTPERENRGFVCGRPECKLAVLRENGRLYGAQAVRDRWQRRREEHAS